MEQRATRNYGAQSPAPAEAPSDYTGETAYTFAIISMYPPETILSSNLRGDEQHMNWAKKPDSSIEKNRIPMQYAIPALLIVSALAFVGGAVRSVRAADAQKTTMDGVYTNDQATRGKTQYSQACANCHMDDLSGSGQALPLAGDAFTETWEGQSVGDLFDLIHNTMPQDKPGTLSPEVTVDVISYLLQFNKFPAGSAELKSDPAALKNILITKKAGSAPPKQ